MNDPTQKEKETISSRDDEGKPPQHSSRSLSDSLHSSENSLQLSVDEEDDPDAAATRLNTWLNGGGSNEFARQLGNGTISAIAPLDPFVRANADLPSPFSTRRSERSLQSLETTLEMERRSQWGDPLVPVERERNALPTPPPILPSLRENPLDMPPSPPLDLSRCPPSTAPPPMTTVTTTTTGGGILRQGDSRRYEETVAPKETMHSEALKNSGSSNGEGGAKPGYQRQRTISWGEKPKPEVAVGTNPAPAPKVSPKVSPTRHVRGPSEFSLFSVLTDSENGSQDTRHGEMKVQLDDIVRMNPLETEAETLVMKIIEAQEAFNRERAHSGILGNVPEEAVHVFLPSPIIDTTSTKSEATSKSAAVGSLQSQRVRMNTVDSPIPSHAPPSQLLSSNNSPPLLTTSANSNSRTGPPAPNQRPPRPNLARNVTVEHKLANLTEALAGFHNQTGPMGEVGLPAPHEDHMVEASAGEKLAQNANLIFRGRQKTEGRPTDVPLEDVSNNSGASGGVGKLPLNRTSSHWSKVRSAAAMIKPPSQPPNADLSAMSNVNGYPAVFATGSVEEHKKTDAVGSDNQHPDDDVECGTAMHDNKTSGRTSHSDDMSRRKSWKLLPQVLNTTAIRDFHVFVSQRRSDFVNYVRFLFLVGVPALGAAFILFYVAGTSRYSCRFACAITYLDVSYVCSHHTAGNPPTGIADLSQSGNGVYFTKNGALIDSDKASVSWWLIFICVRITESRRYIGDKVHSALSYLSSF
jgi:hypothetical protein